MTALSRVPVTAFGKRKVLLAGEVLGDGVQAPGFVVLAHNGTEYVTWFYNEQDGGYHQGHYKTNAADALVDFGERCKRYNVTEILFL